MRPKVALVIIAAGIAVSAMLAFSHKRQKPLPQTESPAAGEIKAAAPVSQAQPHTVAKAAPDAALPQTPASPPIERHIPTPPLPSSADKLERLAQTREYFRALAAGDHTAALQAVKAITNSVERETALLALVTEWTHGELRSPVERAAVIAQYGLEAGLGIELAKDPELALLWADQLTEGQGREGLIGRIAANMVASDPERAFALVQDQISATNQPAFTKGLFALWGGSDTEAALNWAGQLPDPADRDAAIAAIRTQAPVGIGAVLNTEGGYAAIVDMLKGAPAEISGQINKGDRIVALAQGDGAFVDARNIPLADVVKMIRGDPGTALQLQLLAADAPAGSAPRTVTVIRDQVKFKR